MFDPKAIVAANNGRARLLARCILSDLVEPEKNVEPLIQVLVAQEMVAEIKRIKRKDGATRAQSRGVRALAWALRESVEAEIAFMIVVNAIAAAPGLKKTEEYGAFKVQFASILDALDD